MSKKNKKSVQKGDIKDAVIERLMSNKLYRASLDAAGEDSGRIVALVDYFTTTLDDTFSAIMSDPEAMKLLAEGLKGRDGGS